MFKQCFKCGAHKSGTEFYKHPAMGDGLLGKCKECTKADAAAVRNRKIEYYRAYDRARGSRMTDRYRRKYAKENPEKNKATNAVNNAVRDGRLQKAPCVICGSTHRIHGHHDNYARPLDVVWLCAAHHKERHKSLDAANTLSGDI